MTSKRDFKQAIHQLLEEHFKETGEAVNRVDFQWGIEHTIDNQCFGHITTHNYDITKIGKFQ